MLLRPDILFVINDFEFFKTHRLGLADFLNIKGKKVSVITNLRNVCRTEIKQITDNDIDLIDYNFDRASINPILNFYYLIKLFKLLYSINPKKLSLVSAKPAVLGGLCSLFLRFESLFVSITGMGYVFISNTIKARIIRKIILSLYKLIFKQENIKVIFQNTDDRDEFVQQGVIDNAKSVVIKGNGIDTNLFLRKSYPKKITFLFASRLLIDKGVREFIYCCEKVNSENVQFKIAGDIDPINPNSLSEEQFSTIKESNNIEYLGKVEHKKMPELFNSATIFVLPSYREGLPQVALEAASCGMPLILSDVTGCRDCVINHQSGFLIRKGDSEDLLKKIKHFIENPELIERMGNQSRKFIVENFSKELIYKQFFDLYEN